ncbi:hypothetical protein N9164_11420 [Draconibacterium sp.]|nr:hypothetical protein [Draconibacterium sp.]
MTPPDPEASEIWLISTDTRKIVPCRRSILAHQPPGTPAQFIQDESLKVLFLVLDSRAASKSAWIVTRQLALYQRRSRYFPLRCFEDVVLGIESPIAGD